MGPTDKPGIILGKGSHQNINYGKVVSGAVIISGNSNVVVSEEGDVVGRDIVINKRDHGEIISESQAFERIGAGVKMNLEQLKKNIEQARAESTQFFKLTLVFSGIGFLVVLFGVVLLYIGQISAGIVSSVSAVIPEVTAVLFFKKDKELRQSIEAYHQHILESQRILTMVDVSETVKSAEEKDKLKRAIIMRVLGIKTEAA